MRRVPTDEGISRVPFMAVPMLGAAGPGAVLAAVGNGMSVFGTGKPRRVGVEPSGAVTTVLATG